MQQYEQEEIVIIGGGINGMLAALFASQIKNKDGTPRYKITLLEEHEHLGQGASAAFHRIHLGGEYPLDWQTALDCLNGSILWPLIFDHPEIYTDEGPIHFVTALGTHQAAQNGDPESFTFEQNKMFFSLLREAYRENIKKISRGSAKKIPDIQQRLFGDPKFFFRVMTDHELKHYGSVAGGIETREPGLHLHRFMCALEGALRKQPNITIQSGKKAQRVEDLNGSYKVTCADGTEYTGKQVVQAAWAGSFELDGPLRSPAQHKKVKVYRRAIAVVDISGIPQELLPPSTFMYKGKHGGMFSPINSSIAMCYDPEEAQLDECELDSSDPQKRSLPERMTKPLTEEEEQKILERYQANLVKKYPILKHAKFKSLVVRNTLNFDDSLDKRRHEQIQEIRPGYHTVFSTKGTLAIKSAMEATEGLLGRSLKNRHNEPGPISHITNDYILRKATERKCYDVSRLMEFDDKNLMKWLKARGLSASIVPNIERTQYHTADKDDWQNTLAMSWARRAIAQRREKDGAGDNINRTRFFGLGFGNGCQVVVYEQDGPKTGLLLHSDKEENRRLCRLVSMWLGNEEDKHALTDVLPKHSIARALENMFMHLSMTELMDTITVVAKNLSPSELNMLVGNQRFKSFPREVWDRMKSRRPELPSYRDMSIRLSHDPEFIIKYPEAAAIVLSILFSQLEEETKNSIASEIAEILHDNKTDKAFFAKLKHENLNVPLLANPEPMQAHSISNTGRAIKINFQFPDKLEEKGQYIEYQGLKYYPVEYHFHRSVNIARDENGAPILNNGKLQTERSIKNMEGQSDGAPEFPLYSSRYARNAVTLGVSDKDLNANMAGELHAIYMCKLPDGSRRALALASHIKLGAENQGLKPFVDKLNESGKPLTKESPIALSGVDFDPISSFNNGSFFEGKPLPKAVFSSLALGQAIMVDDSWELTKGSSDIFYAGVSVIHLPDEQSATISLQQLEVLERAQPLLETMLVFTDVEPIARTVAARKK